MLKYELLNQCISFMHKHFKTFSLHKFGKDIVTLNNYPDNNFCSSSVKPILAQMTKSSSKSNTMLFLMLEFQKHQFVYFKKQ